MKTDDLDLERLKEYKEDFLSPSKGKCLKSRIVKMKPVFSKDAKVTKEYNLKERTIVGREEEYYRGKQLAINRQHERYVDPAHKGATARLHRQGTFRSSQSGSLSSRRLSSAGRGLKALGFLKKKKDNDVDSLFDSMEDTEREKAKFDPTKEYTRYEDDTGYEMIDPTRHLARVQVKKYLINSEKFNDQSLGAFIQKANTNAVSAPLLERGKASKAKGKNLPSLHKKVQQQKQTNMLANYEKY